MINKDGHIVVVCCLFLSSGVLSVLALEKPTISLHPFRPLCIPCASLVAKYASLKAYSKARRRMGRAADPLRPVHHQPIIVLCCAGTNPLRWASMSAAAFAVAFSRFNLSTSWAMAFPAVCALASNCSRAVTCGLLPLRCGGRPARSRKFRPPTSKASPRKTAWHRATLPPFG